MFIGKLSPRGPVFFFLAHIFLKGQQVWLVKVINALPRKKDKDLKKEKKQFDKKMPTTWTWKGAQEMKKTTTTATEIRAELGIISVRQSFPLHSLSIYPSIYTYTH